jgi:hypothetical protein
MVLEKNKGYLEGETTLLGWEPAAENIANG